MWPSRVGGGGLELGFGLWLGLALGLRLGLVVRVRVRVPRRDHRKFVRTLGIQVDTFGRFPFIEKRKLPIATRREHKQLG